MTLHGIPHALPDSWNGLTFQDYVRFLMIYEPEVVAMNAPAEWMNWCKTS